MQKYKCILLVDDSFETLQLGKRFMTELNIADEIFLTSSGKDAMDYINLNRANSKKDEEVCPEVIFLDIEMPFMDGFEFLEQFNIIHKSIRHKIRIFMLSVSENEEDVQKAKELGTNGYIVKPLTKSKIVDSLLKGLFQK